MLRIRIDLIRIRNILPSRIWILCTYMYRLRKMPTRIFYLYLLNKFIFNVLTTIFFPIQKQSDPEPRQNIWIQTDQDPQHYAVQIAIKNLNFIVCRMLN